MQAFDEYDKSVYKGGGERQLEMFDRNNSAFIVPLYD